MVNLEGELNLTSKGFEFGSQMWWTSFGSSQIPSRERLASKSEPYKPGRDASTGVKHSPPKKIHTKRIKVLGILCLHVLC